MRDQTVVVGFGVTGASAARLLLAKGVQPTDIAAVDRYEDAVGEAIELGISGFVGNCMERTFIAGVVSERTGRVIITAGPDECAVLTTMLIRDLCPHAVVVTAVRNVEYRRHVLRAGADHVLATSEWVGRTLAMTIGQTGSGADVASSEVVLGFAADE